MGRYTFTEIQWANLLLELLHGDADHRLWLVDCLKRFKENTAQIPDWATHFATRSGELGEIPYAIRLEEIPK